MEIAKFILTAIGTFISVLVLSFSVFQYWKKKQDEKFDAFEKAIREEVKEEAVVREKSIESLIKRMERLENNVLQDFQRRMSNIEGELKGIKPILQAIQNWFITNTPAGGKNG